MSGSLQHIIKQSGSGTGGNPVVDFQTNTTTKEHILTLDDGTVFNIPADAFEQTMAAQVSATNVDNSGVIVEDTRSVNELPRDFIRGTYWDFKNNSVVSIPSGNGTFSVVNTVRYWSSAADATGGGVMQTAYTSAGEVYRRYGNISTNTWGAWTKVLTEVNHVHYIEGTRSQILAWRNSNNLKKGFWYIVTDYNRNNVGQAQIWLLATETNVLSYDAKIKTTYDNINWIGKYDIDTHRIISLEDNLGNKVSGRYGNEVDRFDWGNTRYTECIVENADWYVIRGQTTGNYINVVVKNDSYLNTQNHTGTLTGLGLDSYGRVYLNNSTGNIYRTKVSSFSYLYFTGQAGIQIENCTFANHAYVRKRGGTTMRWRHSTVQNYGYFDMTNGNLYAERFSITNFGYITQTGGANLYLYSGGLEGYGRVLHAKTSGNSYIYYSNVSSYGEVRWNEGTGNTYVYYSDFDSNGRAYFDQQSGGTTRLYYHKSSSSSYLYMLRLAGTNNFYGNNFTSRADVRFQDNQNLTVEYNEVSSFGEIYMLNGTNTNRKYIQRNRIDSYARVDLRQVTDLRFRYNSLSSRGHVYCNTATDVQMDYCDFDSGARMDITGTASRSHLNNKLSASARIYTNNFNTSRVIGMGSWSKVLLGDNTNRGRIHNLINDLV